MTLCLILNDAVKPLTTLLVSEIKMATQIPRSKVSDVNRLSLGVNHLK